MGKRSDVSLNDRREAVLSLVRREEPAAVIRAATASPSQRSIAGGMNTSLRVRPPWFGARAMALIPAIAEPGVSRSGARLCEIRRLARGLAGRLGGDDPASAYVRFVQAGVEQPPASPFREAFGG